MYNNKLYTINTLSNLHVGGGDANYSIVDKQVQRDPLTNYPTIHSSSFKGAMREYTKYNEINKQSLTQEGTVPDEITLAGNGIINTVFGQEPKGDVSGEKKAKAGHVIFTEPKLLTLPVRTDKKSFMHAICPKLIKMYNDTCEMYGIESKIPEFEDDAAGYYCQDNISDELIAEEYHFLLSRNEELATLETYIGNNVILLTDKQFSNIATALPVIARNYLENGESKNLFYEEIVPRETKFYVVLRYPNEKIMSMDARDAKSNNHLRTFQESIESIKFYLGANTSIGHGLCELKQLFPKLEEKNDG